jgi:hypothetical protein
MDRIDGVECREFAVADSPDNVGARAPSPHTGFDPVETCLANRRGRLDAVWKVATRRCKWLDAVDASLAKRRSLLGPVVRLSAASVSPSDAVEPPAEHP